MSENGVHIASPERDDKSTVLSLRSMDTLDTGGLPIQALEVSASRFSQCVVERYHAKE